jgi:uncharacterized membrane protein YphA (DoxX/SURF4 family)
MNGPVPDAVAVASAMALAVIFAVAAVAKFRSPGSTKSDFRSLGLPRPELLAVLVPITEVLSALLLLAAPGWGGVLAFSLLAAFTATLAAVLRSGRVASCACFGGTTATPISARHLVRNALLMLLALLAASFDGWIWEL